jgi:hypothetical protein
LGKYKARRLEYNIKMDIRENVINVRRRGYKTAEASVTLSGM